jgi:hypothetical protein
VINLSTSLLLLLHILALYHEGAQLSSKKFSTGNFLAQSDPARG